MKYEKAIERIIYYDFSQIMGLHQNAKMTKMVRGINIWISPTTLRILYRVIFKGIHDYMHKAPAFSCTDNNTVVTLPCGFTNIRIRLTSWNWLICNKSL